MDIEKIASGLIGGAVTGLIAIGTALVSKGKRDAKLFSASGWVTSFCGSVRIQGW